MLRNILFLPHGMQIIPGVEQDPLAGFMAINSHLEELMQKFSESSNNNDVVLLTPHGYNLAEKLVVYNHQKFKGDIFTLNEESNVYGERLQSYQFEGNEALTQKVMNLLPETSYEVLTHGSNGYPLTLNWGTMVPLHYYHPVNPDSKYTIMCYPRSRHDDLGAIIELNKLLVSVIDELDQDIVLVVSGDLSHVHQESGPYGFHKSATKFDDLIQEWAKNPSNDKMLDLLEMQPKALACGMSGLQLINTLFQLGNYVLRGSFYEVPTYFGMGGYWWQRLEE